MHAVLFLIYFGTYTGSGSDGIYVAEFNSQLGKISNVRLAAKTENPSFLHLHPNGKYLYSVTETNDGSVLAWKILKDGTLELINEQKAGGDAACFVTLSPDSKHAAIANYTSGNIAVYPVGKDGSLGEATARVQHEGSSVHRRQSAPHAHSIQFDPAGNFVLSADLGIDKLMVYAFDNGTLVEAGAGELEPGSGPRHFAFSSDGRHVAVINELTCTATTFAYDSGNLKKLSTVSTLPGDHQSGFSTAEILFHPSGKFVYGSNRGHDSIAAFSFEAESGQLSPVGHVSSGGKTPRNFRVSPDGRWLVAANQGSGNVVVHKIDQKTGMVAPTGHEVKLDKPVCIKFLMK